MIDNLDKYVSLLKLSRTTEQSTTHKRLSLKYGSQYGIALNSFNSPADRQAIKMRRCSRTQSILTGYSNSWSEYIVVSRYSVKLARRYIVLCALFSATLLPFLCYFAFFSLLLFSLFFSCLHGNREKITLTGRVVTLIFAPFSLLLFFSWLHGSRENIGLKVVTLFYATFSLLLFSLFFSSLHGSREQITLSGQPIRVKSCQIAVCYLFSTTVLPFLFMLHGSREKITLSGLPIKVKGCYIVVCFLSSCTWLLVIRLGLMAVAFFYTSFLRLHGYWLAEQANQYYIIL